MKILAIESSCDETAAAVVEDGVNVLSNVVISQIDIFAEYGGVIPEVAARSHLEAILPVVHKALDDAGLTEDGVDCVAVTHTPGLMGSLLIGTLTARMLAILWKKPLYAVHHLKSHIYANWLSCSGKLESANALSLQYGCTSPHLKIRNRRSPGSQATILQKKALADPSSPLPGFPLLALVVSGGHTQIIYMKGHDQFEIIGTTRDDAVGECFDKVAKILGLPYPGGPSIAQISAISSLNSPVRSHRTLSTAPLRASSSSRTSSKFEAIEEGESFKEHSNYKLPHPKVEGLDFSFSGLKTAVLRAVQAECGVSIRTPSYELAEKLTKQQRADFAAVFQETACEILIEKMEKALEAHPEARSVVIAGGVSANKVLREMALERLQEASGGKIRVFFPDLKYAGDNAAMVGAAAYFEIKSGVEPTDPYALNIAPRTPIG